MGEELKRFMELAVKVISREYAEMPRTCRSCGRNMVFAEQHLVVEPKPGDLLIYRCERCGDTVEKLFEFPEEYARYFRKR